MNSQLNQLTHEIIGASIEVHRTLGPGLLESAYRECLRRELLLRGIPYCKEYPLPLEYKGDSIGMRGIESIFLSEALSQ